VWFADLAACVFECDEGVGLVGCCQLVRELSEGIFEERGCVRSDGGFRADPGPEIVV
jgi:hypothetical protein